jgi:hypothetical protein
MEELGTIFISYSHDSVEHVKTVLELSNKLRSEGIDCVLDQYEVSPPEGWPRWMDKEIKKAKYVLMICTENYYKRVMDEEPEDVGMGIKWEGHLIYQHIYNAGSQNTKFIPILLSSNDKKNIPTPLQGATYYTVDDQEGYDDLYYRLSGQPKVEKPPLGKRRSLPKKEVKTNVAMFLSMPIDIDLWNAAKWRATFFLIVPGKIPILGLAFKKGSQAKQIFEDWHERYGENDEFEEVRISIIEGDIKGEEPGYSVHIGPDPENTIKRYKKFGFKVDSDLLMCVSRINRMNPPAESRNLEMFKQSYRKHKSYLLIPGVISDDNKQLKPFIELSIHKNTVHFRDVGDIGTNDIDSVVLARPKEL